jgi:hypothetical protein
LVIANSTTLSFRIIVSARLITVKTIEAMMTERMMVSRNPRSILNMLNTRCMGKKAMSKRNIDRSGEYLEGIGIEFKIIT